MKRTYTKNTVSGLSKDSNLINTLVSACLFVFVVLTLNAGLLTQSYTSASLRFLLFLVFVNYITPYPLHMDGPYLQGRKLSSAFSITFVTYAL